MILNYAILAPILKLFKFFTKKMIRKILVTTALPYANGPLHLGHILENIQADIWVRWQRMCGHEVLFLGGDDAHGTPIMLNAEKQSISPEELVTNIKKEHEKDLADFYIEFDNFYTTHSEENKELTYEIYQKLKSNGDIISRTIEQAYDETRNMFLPDRFIKGTCPRCKAENQYGDSCEVCGATYSASEMINPVSRLSGQKPVLKSSLHLFFSLEKHLEFLKNWTREPGHLQLEIQHKLEEWFKEGLRSWDISRDAPYFGFKIPGETDKYFYVWLDAPIGYMASLKNLCQKKPGLNFDDYWRPDSTAELYHFIGKDIVYFHSLFWPAVLKSAQFRLPTAIFTHGFVTINGQKMSKSRGTFITASHYLQHLSPEYLRYYFATKLNNSIDDLDLNGNDLIQRVNSDLVGKVVNIASRCARFINQYFNSKLSDQLSNEELFKRFIDAKSKIAQCYEQRKYSILVREIMTLADLANQYLDAEKPWVLAKNPNELYKVQAISTLGLNLFRVLIIYLKPILPKMSEAVETFFNVASLKFEDLNQPLLNHVIEQFKPLMQRVDEKQAKILFGSTGV